MRYDILRVRICALLGSSAAVSAATISACQPRDPETAHADLAVDAAVVVVADVDAASATSTASGSTSATTPATTASTGSTMASGEPHASAVRSSKSEALAAVKAVDPATLATAAACSGNDLRETICGLVKNDAAYPSAPAPFDDCTTTGIGLASYGTSSAPLWDDMASHAPGNASFAYDARATHAYRLQYIQGMADTSTSSPAACCFTRCSEVVRGPAREAPPTTETCIVPSKGRWPKASQEPRCPSAVLFSGENLPVHRPRFSAGKCCYTTYVAPPPHPRGRPLSSGERSVVAPTIARDGWTLPRSSLDALDASDALDALDAETRIACARAWSETGAAEHASIAAFAKLSLELLAFGAPADLVDAAHAAARDEVRHAADAYALASAFAGKRVGPGALDLAGVAPHTELAAFARAAFVEGCVGETLAALEADEALRVVRERDAPDAPDAPDSRDSRIARVLDVVARDEARHAELSWRVVAWALAEGGAPVRDAITREVSRIREELDLLAAERTDIDDENILETYGVLSTIRASHVRARGIASVVLPCADVLLA